MGLKIDDYKAPAMDPVNAIHFLAGYLDAIKASELEVSQVHINDISTCIFMSAADHIVRRNRDRP